MMINDHLKLVLLKYYNEMDMYMDLIFNKELKKIIILIFLIMEN